MSLPVGPQEPDGYGLAEIVHPVSLQIIVQKRVIFGVESGEIRIVNGTIQQQFVVVVIVAGFFVVVLRGIVGERAQIDRNTYNNNRAHFGEYPVIVIVALALAIRCHCSQN